MYHKEGAITLSSNVENSEALIIDLIEICSMLFEIESKLIVRSKDGIMKGGEALIIFEVEPFFAGGGSELFRVRLYQLVVHGDEVLSKIIVVCVGCHM